MRVGSVILYDKVIAPKRLLLILCLTIFITLSIVGCSSEAPVTSGTTTTKYNFPSEEEMMVLLESCGQETYQGVKALIRDIEVNDLLQLKIDYKKFKEIDKNSGPICVVARGPINKFTSEIEVN